MRAPEYPFDEVGRNWLSPDESRWPADLRVTRARSNSERNSLQTVLWEIGVTLAVPLCAATFIYLCLDLLAAR